MTTPRYPSRLKVHPSVTKICKILLVEDERDIQDLLRTLFASEGYRFLIVGNGASMRRILATETDIDVVIIDVLLPGGTDGLGLAKEAADRGLPVILVTGDHGHFEKLEASGHRYLLKPFPLSSFLEMIETVLRETQIHCERDVPKDDGPCDPLPLRAANNESKDDPTRRSLSSSP